MNLKQFKIKFVEILNTLQPEINFEDKDIVQILSHKWMEVLDKNNSGSITSEEFHEAFSRIDVEIAWTHMTQIYDFINIDGG